MITTRKQLLISLLFSFLICTSHVFADKVDDVVRRDMAERHIPGAAVAILKNGKPIKVQGYGLASLEFNVPVTNQSVFEIGSVSKQMTASAIMLLVEDGKVSLDERISKYLPTAPDSWKDVTVRHLLTHSSGIKSYSSLDGFALLRRLKVDDFIKQLAPHPLEFTPGEKTAYGNSGFSLLAYIIESASGKPYIEFMRERIFNPLGMSTAGDRDPAFIIRNRVTGYDWTGERYTGRDWDLTDLKGAGTIVATIDDLIKWNQALSGNNFLKPASKAEIWKPYTFTSGGPSVYGFGWRISELRGHKLVGHTGQTAGFNSANFRYPDQDLVVVVLTNNGIAGLAGQMAVRIAKLYTPAMSLASMKAVADNKAWTQKISAAFQSRFSGKPDPTMLTAQLIQTLSTDRAKQVDQRLTAKGSFKGLTLVGVDSGDSKKTYLYRADTGGRLSLWRIAMTENGLIAEMTLEEEE